MQDLLHCMRWSPSFQITLLSVDQQLHSILILWLQLRTFPLNTVYLSAKYYTMYCHSVEYEVESSYYQRQAYKRRLFIKLLAKHDKFKLFRRCPPYLELQQINLIKFHADFKVTSYEEIRQILRIAAKMGHTRLVQKCTQLECDPFDMSYVYGCNHSAFSIACKNGKLRTIKYMIATNTQTKPASSSRSTFSDGFRSAISHNHFHVVRYFIRHAYINPIKESCTPAAAHNHLRMMRYLISNDILPDKHSLWSACNAGHLRIVRFLVKYGVDIHADDEEALFAACSSGFLPIVKYLIRHGAKFIAQGRRSIELQNPSSNYCESRIMYITMQNGHVHVIRYLLSLGADIRHIMEPEFLQNACISGDIETVRFLIDCGLDPTFEDKRAFKLACKHKKYDIVEYLARIGYTAKN